MTDPTPTPTPAPTPTPSSGQPSSAPSVKPPPTVFDCLSGSAIASLITWLAYLLTVNTVNNFTAKPFSSTNYVAVNIASAVRTLVMGMFSMGTVIFGIAALGLFALGIQTLIQGQRSQQP
jgi:hypothetical protein